MWTPILVAALWLMQSAGERTPQDSRERLAVVLDRASRESDLDGAGLILSSLLSDEATVRSAFLTSVVLDERSIYILFGGNWGSRARVSWKDRKQEQRIRAESVSTKPVLIRAVIRADRYESYFSQRHPRGASTINSYPFFDKSPYADDLVEAFMERLRQETTHPAKAIVSPYNELRAKGSPPMILVTADEVEVNLLGTWQMLCGVCDRLDLVDKASTKNWRDRFPELDNWFHKNRPYTLWDDSKSCIKIDDDAKEFARPTPRASRSIPELKPPWLSEKR